MALYEVTGVSAKKMMAYVGKISDMSRKKFFQEIPLRTLAKAAGKVGSHECADAQYLKLWSEATYMLMRRGYQTVITETGVELKKTAGRTRGPQPRRAT